MVNGVDTFSSCAVRWLGRTHSAELQEAQSHLFSFLRNATMLYFRPRPTQKSDGLAVCIQRGCPVMVGPGDVGSAPKGRSITRSIITHAGIGTGPFGELLY